ncbi:MAG: RraA family protein [Acidobacteriia bacterium]|jgi:regulator of RNase E activity RraA|nr:RraA family protein [Terriglobia bacterium]
MALVDLLHELREFDTALIANTIGYIDKTPAHEFYMGNSIQSVTPTLGPTVGVAMTCQLDSSTPGNQANPEPHLQQLEQILELQEPVVWVVQTVGSRPDHECVLGDGMAKELFSVGCVGVVTDGGVRDIEGLLSIPFAAYSKGKTIHHCALNYKEINNPVNIGGITIRSGDVIHANNEGVIRVPTSCLEKLPTQAIKMRSFEQDVHRFCRRTDSTPRSNRKRVEELLKHYGFSI